MKIWRHQKGFSLVEMIIAITLLGIISVSVSQILAHAYELYINSLNIAESDWQGNLAINRMAEEIHNIRSASDISTIASTQLAFTDVSGTSVTYNLSGSNLQRNGATLASGVSAFALAYKDANGTTTASTSLVRYITISLTLTFGGLSQSFVTQVGTRGMS